MFSLILSSLEDVDKFIYCSEIQVFISQYLIKKNQIYLPKTAITKILLHLPTTGAQHLQSSRLDPKACNSIGTVLNIENKSGENLPGQILWKWTEDMVSKENSLQN